LEEKKKTKDEKREIRGDKGTDVVAESSAGRKTNPKKRRGEGRGTSRSIPGKALSRGRVGEYGGVPVLGLVGKKRALYAGEEWGNRISRNNYLSLVGKALRGGGGGCF